MLWHSVLGIGATRRGVEWTEDCEQDDFDYDDNDGNDDNENEIIINNIIKQPGRATHGGYGICGAYYNIIIMIMKMKQ